MPDAPLKFPEAETVLERDDYERMKSVEELKNTLESEVDLSPSRRQKLKGKISGKDIEDLKALNAYRQSKKDWWKLNRREIEPTKKPFPTSTVEYKGKKCDLYGYVHGDQIFGVSPEVMNSLNQEVENSIEDNQPVLVEEGLMRHIYPENSFHPLSNSLKDCSLFAKEPTKKDILLAPLGIAAMIGKSFFRRGAATIGRFSNSLGLETNHVIDQARRKPEHMEDARNAYEASSGPMNLRADYAKNHSDYRLRTLKRSAHQIETAVQKTPEEAEKVNLVVGLAHVSEIEHYVENPESISIDTL